MRPRSSAASSSTSKGRTLYLFEKDRRSRSACYGACAAYWPPLLTRGQPTAGRGVKRPLLGVARRSDGRSQVTYAGHPLYRFVPDTKPGQTTGQGLDQFGAERYVLSPTGKKIETRNKRVAVIGASTGLLGALAAQAELRKVLKVIGASVLETALPIPVANTAFTTDGRLREPELARSSSGESSTSCSSRPWDGPPEENRRSGYG